MKVQVYLPIAVTIDTNSGLLLEVPEIDFDGAPWMYVLTEDNIWDIENQKWFRDEDAESVATLELHKNYLGRTRT